MYVYRVSMKLVPSIVNPKTNNLYAIILVKYVLKYFVFAYISFVKAPKATWDLASTS